MNLKSKLPTRYQKYASFGIIPKLLLAPVAFLILCGFLLAKPFVQFRLYRMVDSRIGHLAINTEIVRLKNIEFNKTAKKREIIVYCSENWNCSNNALRKLFFRNSFRLRGPIAWLALTLCRIFPKFQGMNTAANQGLNIDRIGLLERPHNHLALKDFEYSRGQKFLKECNVFDNRFVCILVRDDAYLEKISGYKVQKHEYRDSEVSSYLKAAYVLAEMGYTVFRMGAAVKEPLHSRHPLVIDYASNGMRTEFLDVFLGAHCKFCISTGSGWDNIPTIFGKKKLLVNHLPVFGPDAVTASHIIYPKILRDIKSGSTLGISELIERNIQSALRTKSYESAGVEIINLSEEEIVDAVIEMAQRVEGTFVETEFQSAIQDKLRHILSVHPRLQPSPGFYPIRATYASCFLNRYPNFLPD